MTIFLSGGAKNGKSTLAQELAVKLSGAGKRYYVATMIPTDEEDLARIRRHIADRDGLGFETIECSKNMLSCLDTADRDGTFLVDSATALLQNAMFPAEKNWQLDLDGANRCADELIAFVKTVKNAVVVSDFIYSDAQRYDETTELYRKCLAAIDRRLAAACDVVAEVAAGNPKLYKGALPLKKPIFVPLPCASPCSVQFPFPDGSGTRRRGEKCSCFCPWLGWKLGLSGRRLHGPSAF